MTIALDVRHRKAIDGFRWLAVLHTANRIGLNHNRRVACQDDRLARQFLTLRRINSTGGDVLSDMAIIRAASETAPELRRVAVAEIGPKQGHSDSLTARREEMKGEQ